jgi:hypothetical protein
MASVFIELNFIVDPVKICKCRIHDTQYLESFCARNGKNIASCFTLLDAIKSELTIDKKRTSVYISRHRSAPDDRISTIAIGYIGVTMVTLVVLSIIVGDIPIIVVYLKKRFGF